MNMAGKRLDDQPQESMAMIVTCYVEGRGDQWEGVCLDFDLAVHGSSFSEVSKKLDGAIHEYLEYLGSIPEDDRQRLLARPVPLGVRLGFMMRVLATWLFRSRDNDGNHWNAYTLPCAA